MEMSDRSEEIMEGQTERREERGREAEQRGYLCL